MPKTKKIHKRAFKTGSLVRVWQNYDRLASNRLVGYVRYTAMYSQKLGDMDQLDIVREGRSYMTVKQFHKTYFKNVASDDNVLVIRFKFMGMAK